MWKLHLQHPEPTAPRLLAVSWYPSTDFKYSTHSEKSALEPPGVHGTDGQPEEYRLNIATDATLASTLPWGKCTRQFWMTRPIEPGTGLATDHYSQR